MSVDYARLIKHCKLCNAEIIWLRNERTGNMAPIDAALGWGGNVEIDLDELTYGVRKFEGRHRAYRIHFFSCPNRPKRGKPVAGAHATG